jgi:post-segregation antitoxin (ccd killing protein)
MNEALNQDSTWKNNKSPRGNYHNKTDTKTTVSLYLNKILVEKARIHRLNLSRITEQALNSILDYLQTQNNEIDRSEIHDSSILHRERTSETEKNL